MPDPSHRRSYYKTVLTALVACALLVDIEVALLVANASHRWSTVTRILWDAAIVLDAVAFFACLLVVAGGVISLRRDRKELLGKPYARVARARSTHRQLTRP